jgi:hypothetical protein
MSKKQSPKGKKQSGGKLGAKNQLNSRNTQVSRRPMRQPGR